MLHSGDHVRMINCTEADDYPDRIWSVTSEEQIICGTPCVMLQGFSGCFDAMCLLKV